MGKRITQQARGKGSMTFRVKKKAYRYRVGYPALNIVGNAEVIKLINSLAHSAPLAKIAVGKEKKVFYIPAAQGLYESQEIEIGGKNIGSGNIVYVKDAPIGTRIFNIEKRPGDGGKMVRTSGGFSTILKQEKGKTVLLMTNKKEVRLHENCRATVGMVAGQGRVAKPIVKAGKTHHMMKSIGRKWHRTSAVKVNAVDHPFGGGRGKRIKSKIAKRNAPPGRKVGHILPRKTGRKKGKRR